MPSRPQNVAVAACAAFPPSFAAPALGRPLAESLFIQNVKQKMLVCETDKKNDETFAPSADIENGNIVCLIRVFLGLSVVLTLWAVPSPTRGPAGLAWWLPLLFLVYGAVLYGMAKTESALARSRALHWIDALVLVQIVLYTGGLSSLFFLLFLFPILTASFNHGFEEGARVTLFSTVAFIAGSLLTQAVVEPSSLLMRTSFLLALGYMSAHWGESKVNAYRRLTLLRNVSRISNPRFGMDRTIASILERMLRFFDGDSCILLITEKDTGNHTLRIARAGKPGLAREPSRIDGHAAAPLLALESGCRILYVRPLDFLTAFSGTSVAYDAEGKRWRRANSTASAELAELFGAHALISIPVSLRMGEGRLFLTSRERRLNESDARFLEQVAAHAFPVIDNIALVDRLASEAAESEHRKIALDLHDTAVQPYVGLRLGLAALRNKAGDHNPLNEDLERLMDMSTNVIQDLRNFFGTMRRSPSHKLAVHMSALDESARRAKALYGIDIDVHIQENLRLNDRLAAEVLHLVNEGLNNICKHTASRCGRIEIDETDETLHIRIVNAVSGEKAAEFIPRSITQRVGELGGETHVSQEPGSTGIYIAIPM